MLNFGRRDRLAEAKNTNKNVLKPALYDPPGSAGRTTAAGPARPTTASPQNPTVAGPPTLSLDVAVPPATSAQKAEPPGSRLFVGVNIKLRGVEISDCDVLVIEGHVEATVHSKAMEIAKPGMLKGTALIDVAEIHGEFVGELTARTRLVIHGTGRVSGTIRYGKLIIAEGGELNGDVQRLDDAADPAPASRITSSAGPIGLPPAGHVASH
ncbi:MAG: polymer-forming cytoskeletal protein [Casimicrobiaceae bacterium]